ncbi:hypothetical protein ACSMXM_13245 [Pacificimonas sp. ICDLI1SI03]
MSGTRFLLALVSVGMFLALAAGAVLLKKKPDMVADLGAPVATAYAAASSAASSASSASATVPASAQATTMAAELPTGATVSLDTLDAAGAGEWVESQVTHRYWNRAQKLSWQQKPIDYVDADGTPQGPRPFAEGSFSTSGPVRLKLPEGLRDIYVVTSKGRITVKTRETGEGPVLVLADGRRLDALADADINFTTVKRLGDRDSMKAEGDSGFLIRFPAHSGPATLELQRVEGSNKSGTLKVYQASPRAPKMAFPSELPAARAQILRVAAGDVRRSVPERQQLQGEWLATWLDRESAPQKRCNETDIGCSGLVLMQDRQALPQSLDRAAMVTYFRIGGVWSDTGGKMPGLGNSGDTTKGPRTCIGDSCYGDAGWGGRKANGLRWHARGLFTGSGGTGSLGWGTYLYSLNVNAGPYGKHLAAAEPLPPGEVVATVQYIDVNDVGSDNGILGQWLCRASGCTPMIWRDDIRYRNVDAPEALVNEMDLVIYCGGMQCNMRSGQRFEYDFHSAAVFDGMPDLRKVADRVSRLASTVPSR